MTASVSESSTAAGPPEQQGPAHSMRTMKTHGGSGHSNPQQGRKPKSKKQKKRRHGHAGGSPAAANGSMPASSGNTLAAVCMQTSTMDCLCLDCSIVGDIWAGQECSGVALRNPAASVLLWLGWQRMLLAEFSSGSLFLACCSQMAASEWNSSMERSRVHAVYHQATPGQLLALSGDNYCLSSTTLSPWQGMTVNAAHPVTVGPYWV